MGDNIRGESELLAEVRLLRRRVAELEAAQAGGKGLNKREHQLALLLENMPVMLDAFDSGGNIILWNKECEHVTGYSRQEIVGNPRAMELLYPDTSYRERMMREWKERGNDYYNWEWETTCKDGSIKAVQWSNLSDVYPVEGWATWGIGVDVTEMKGTQAAVHEKEQMLEGLFNATTESVFLVRADGVVCAVNKTAARRLGMKQEDLIGRDVKETHSEAVPPDVARSRIQAIREVVNSGKGTRLQDERGGAIIDTSMYPVFDNEGRVTYVAIFGRDISEEKRAEQEMRKFKAISDEAGYGTAMADPQGNLIYVNKALAEMHGYLVSEMLGKNLSVLHTAEQMQQVSEMHRRLLETGSYVGEEVWHRKKDGTVFPTLMNGNVIRDEKGQPAFFGATAVDITEHRLLEQRLAEYRDKLVRAERLASVGTLSAALAHELTQPLSAIQLSIQNSVATLDEKLSPELLRGLLDNVLSGASRAAEIVSDFRDFARRSSVRRPTKVCLAETGRRIVQLLRSGAKRARMELRLEGLDLLPDVLCDERDVEQLFFVLTQNAVQAADGKRRRRLLIRGTLKDEHVELQFCDDCGGICPENMDSLFEPFFTTKPPGEGTGLGLSIARDIMSRAGGSIRVESEHGAGTTFFVTYPLKRGGALL